METKIIVQITQQVRLLLSEVLQSKEWPKDKKYKQSGKTKVKTDSVFLGTADAILEKCQNFDKPKKVLFLTKDIMIMSLRNTIMNFQLNFKSH